MKTLQIHDDEITIIWSVADVLEQCPWLTNEQAFEVLHNLYRKHDCTIGINWDVIDVTADIMFGDKRNDNNQFNC